MDLIQTHYNYGIIILLMMIGLFAMMAKKNLFKKVIGMTIFQSAIIFFFIGISEKEEARIPILDHLDEPAANAAKEMAASPGASEVGGADRIDPAKYVNPLPHVLMLTAIVVGVATLGVALALIQKIYMEHGTMEEDKILERVN